MSISVVTSTRKFFEKFWHNTKGSIGVPFALGAVALIAAGGTAIDFSRKNDQQTAAQTALDRAVLAVALSYQTDGDKRAARRAGRRLLRSNKDKFIQKLRPSFEIKTDRVTASVESSTKTTFMALLMVNKMNWNAYSVVRINKPQSLEFSLAVDISVSMAGGGHMATLRRGLTDFVAAAFGSNASQGTSVSLLPYAAGVSFAPKYTTWLDPMDGYSKSPSFFGCFFAEPIATKASLSSSETGSYIAAPQGSFVSKVLNGQVFKFCPEADTQASLFQTDQTTLTDKIARLQSYGGTDTAAGLSWAWRALDRPWGNVFQEPSTVYPKRYTNGNKKVLILFTDGNPKPAAWPGETKDIAAQKIRGMEEFKATCAAIKADGRIDLYAIAYGNSFPPDGLAEMKKCTAGNGEFMAATSLNLSEVFESIVNKYKSIAIIE